MRNRTGRAARFTPIAAALTLLSVTAPLRAAPSPLPARGTARPAAPASSAVPWRASAPDTIDAWVEAYMRAHHIPGLALGIYRAGRIVKAKGYGLADVELDVPVTPHTIFQSGSVGKQFTSAMILLLARDGKLALDDPITKYLPEGADVWKGITIRNLLTHTSGIQDYENADPPIVDLRRDYTDAQLAHLFARLPLVFPPGTTWSYSNTGYVLLGIIIDRVTGAHWNVFLHDRVFGPLGMKTARMIGLPDIIPNRASGYVMDDGHLANQEWVSPTWEHTADGALYFTVLDLARWDAGLSGDAFLTAAEKREMWTPVHLADGTTTSYGFGWEVRGRPGHRVVEHAGGWQGFSTHIVRYVDDSVTVAVLTNLAGAATPHIAHEVAWLYDPALRPPEPHAMRLDPGKLESYAGLYRFPEGDTLRLTASSGALRLETPRGTTLEFRPSAPDSFFVAGTEWRLRFERDPKDGSVAWVRVLRTLGSPDRARRVR
ncbi:MAG: serine hydrolase domain-containing protein [Candidatus Palauibacterales bacterium]|nr:serine hydrolase domain-containing protein [Candidatus Palauibacterales bacterium]MDP2584207.1 serine hydrolase domain-containing protein [Candidatus Palauibacterales bacterium]